MSTSYDKSLKQLNTLLAEIQDPNTNIDSLSKKITKAKTLIHACKTKLRNIETEVNDIFE